MASTTDNFNLDLYDTGDPANLTDQYNASMRIIDKNMLTISGTAATAINTATEANNTASTALNLTQNNKTDITKLNTNVDTINTNINELDTNLTALGANTVNDATNLKNTISKNTQDIITIKNTLNDNSYNSGYMVTFGDSYADSTTPENTWPYWLHQYIPTLTLKNYAVSGAGFNVDTRTFISQINTAYADGTLDRNQVKLAVLAGGRNDILNYNNAYTLMQECVKRMITIFPNAQILIVPMLHDDSYVPADSREKLTGLTRGAEMITNHTPNAETLKFAYIWLKGEPNYIGSDSIHPNQLGAQTIAKYIYDGAYHNYTPRQEVDKTNFGSATGFITLQDGIVTYDLMGNVTNIGSGQGADLPAWAETWHNVWVWGVSSGSISTPRLYQFLGTKVTMMNHDGQTGNMSIHATWTA
jgi:lysophospholipase L1-like esterase|nr:MAG TPA: hypothetical protein [Bacteriophage sp.]